MSSAQVPSEIRYQERLAVLLAGVAGFVDAYGIIRYGAYLSFMSGNTTSAGVDTGQGNWFAVAPLITGIVAFTAGVFAGTLLVHRWGVRARRTIFLLIALAIAVVIGLTAIPGMPAILLLAVISFAMGSMNASLSQVGAQSINLTFVTGTLNRFGKHLAGAVSRAPLDSSKGAWDTHLHRAMQLGGIWLGFFLGAVISGRLTPPFGARSLLAPVIILMALAWLDHAGQRLVPKSH
jgi:uncharacterized membrane protein YoaK (UPF0700 family)